MSDFPVDYAKQLAKLKPIEIEVRQLSYESPGIISPALGAILDEIALRFSRFDNGPYSLQDEERDALWDLFREANEKWIEETT